MSAPDRQAAELRDALRRTVETGDALRKRVAWDVHDGPQQQLVACVVGLQRARQNWSSDPAKARQLLDSGLEQAQSALDALRDLVAGIHPPILTHLGLRPAVEALAARLPIHVSLDLPGERLPPPVEASVYFLVEEALTDAVDHAEASTAAVKIALDDRRLTVEARDDGTGGARVTDAAGSRLSALADRVASLDGELTIERTPAGTFVHAEIPLPGAPRPGG